MNKTKTTIATKTLLATAVAGSLSLLSAMPAVAQTTPSYAVGTSDQTINGTVSSINGQYNISVRDVNGYIDNVTLHQGTIINPTGLTLERGQSVKIIGHADGSTFEANEIDTPYQPVALVPGYPYYGYGYDYGFGPIYNVGLRFGRGFGFGFRG